AVANGLAYDPEDQAAADHVPPDADSNFDALRDELLGVTVEQTGDALAGLAQIVVPADVVPAGAVGAVREEPDAQDAPGAVDAVNADRAHRVVDADLVEEEDA